jgi:hypothetical protein
MIRNVNFNILKFLNLFLCLAIIFALGCSAAPATPVVNPAISQPAGSPHVRKLMTPSFSGGGAVIFVLDGINNSNLKDPVDQVIRIFGENNAPLDIAVKPPEKGGEYNTVTGQLAYYSDAGIIDVSTDGNTIGWWKFSSPPSGIEYDRLVAGLVNTRNQVRQTFGTFPYTCLLPPGAINEANYRALQDSGFKVLCSLNTDSLKPSVMPVSWSGNIEAGGLYRLPIIGTVSPEVGTAQTPKLLAEARTSIDALGVAVIQIDISSLIDSGGKIDTAVVTQLNEIVKACQELGDVTTLESWYGYISECPLDATGIKRPLPPYVAGPIIIFRLDDVSKGYREEVVQEIIKLFQRNGVPIDCGVVSNANGTDSYQIPWLKKYVDQNSVGLSVHGYDWTFYQLDISKLYLKHIDENACINVNTARAEADKAKISYQELKYRLMQARCKFLKYYGIIPVSFTVPTDYYDSLGYEAIRDAGYKVFSVHRTMEPCPSNVPVDYSCHIDLDKGMYRLPTSSDLCTWYQCRWDTVVNIDKPMAQKDYCVYVDAWGESQEYNDFAIATCTDMNALGVAVVSLHPDCFADKDGNPDMAKLEKVDTIIKWFKSFATIMTFEQWYRYRIGDK